MGAHEEILKLRQRMGRNIIGQEQVVERLLLSNSTIVVNSVPAHAHKSPEFFMARTRRQPSRMQPDSFLCVSVRLII